MAGRSAKCSLSNQTKELLQLDPQGTTLSGGTWSPAPPTTCGDTAAFGVQAGDSGTEGTVRYVGAGGSVVLAWNVPSSGQNGYHATPSGAYGADATGNAAGADAAISYSVYLPDQDGTPTSEDVDPPDNDRPKDYAHQSHVPLHSTGPVVLSSKRWLIDVAWQAVNHTEWDSLILEITENRHGNQHGAPCPQTLPQFDGVAEQGICQRPHAELRKKRGDQWKARLIKEGMDKTAAEAMALDDKLDSKNPIWNDFHSWCGDYVSWVFWKAWVLKNKPEDKVTKAELGKFLNREALNGSWNPSHNLTMIEAYGRNMTFAEFNAKGAKRTQGDRGRLLCWHDFPFRKDNNYWPTPGDIWLSNRSGGGHIGMVAWAEDRPPDLGKSEAIVPNTRGWAFTSLDGKSYDREWSGAPQGVAQGHRSSDNKIIVDEKTKAEALDVRAFVETTNLRIALGYR